MHQQTADNYFICSEVRSLFTKFVSCPLRLMHDLVYLTELSQLFKYSNMYHSIYIYQTSCHHMYVVARSSKEVAMWTIALCMVPHAKSACHADQLPMHTSFMNSNWRHHFKQGDSSPWTLWFFRRWVGTWAGARDRARKWAGKWAWAWRWCNVGSWPVLLFCVVGTTTCAECGSQVFTELKFQCTLL